MLKRKSPQLGSASKVSEKPCDHAHSEPCKARIGTVSEAPHWVRQPFILYGYRLGFSLIQSILSLFSLHNETGTLNLHRESEIDFLLTSWNSFSSQHLDPSDSHTLLHLGWSSFSATVAFGRDAEAADARKGRVSVVCSGYNGRIFPLSLLQLRGPSHP